MPTPAADDDALSLPPVDADREPVSLPPVVPVDEPVGLPPVDADDEPLSLPPVDAGDEPLSLPPVVPDDASTGPLELSPDSPDLPAPERRPAAERAARAATNVARRCSSPTWTDPPVNRPRTSRVRRAEDGPATAEAAAVDESRSAEPAALTTGAGAQSSDAAEQRSGWAVLGRALRPRLTRAQVLAGILCAVLGFALVAQVRQSSGADLAGMRQGDLVRILDETTNRGDALARESADLGRERDDLLSGSDRRQAALDALRRSAETQGILTGRLPAEGPGVVVTLTEPDGLIKPFTMLNLLEELRNAGAEAVQLNDQRVTASSAFTGTGGAIVLDGVALTAPYRWIAIGDPDIISPALQIPGGAMAQVRNNGGKGTVESPDLVQVDAIRDVPDPVYATPVPPTGD